MDGSENSVNPTGHISMHSVARGRGRPRRHPVPSATPQLDNSASSNNRRRRTQLRNIGQSQQYASSNTPPICIDIEVSCDSY
jgi:hypothetical protein